MTAQAAPGTSPARHPGRRRPACRVTRSRSGWLRELGLLAVLDAGYEVVRALAPARVGVAFDNAHTVQHLEALVHLDVEPAANRALEAVPALTAPAGLVYQAHLLALAATLVWLWRRHPAAYLPARRALVATTLAGLVGYWLLPTAPPRFAMAGVTDTLLAHPVGLSGNETATGLANLYAAMPSLHCAWAAWVALAVAGASARPARRLAWLHPAATVGVVVATGNHYVLDVVAGIAVAFAAWLLVARLPSLAAPDDEPPARRLGTPPARSVVIGKHPLADALAVRLQAEGGVLRVPDPLAVTAGDVASEAPDAAVVYRFGPAAPSPDPARSDLALVAAGLLRARLVLAQDLDVVGPPDGRPYTEDRPCEPDTTAGRAAQALHDAAVALHRLGRLDTVVVRVPPLYGVGVGAESDLGIPAVRAVATGRVVRPRRDPDVMHAYTYLPDAVTTLHAAGHRTDLAGATLITPVDPALRTTRDLLRIVAVHAGAPAPRVALPRRWRHRRRHEDVEPVDVDSGTTERLLGVAPTPYDVAVPRLVAGLAAPDVPRPDDRRLRPPHPIG